MADKKVTASVEAHNILLSTGIANRGESVTIPKAEFDHIVNGDKAAGRKPRLALKK